jgi:hypothetical protein
VAADPGIVESGVGAAVVEEAVGAAAVVEIADDLARVVDVCCKGAGAGDGIVEGGVSEVVGVVEEAVIGGVVGVISDDQLRVIDADRPGAVGGEGILEDGVAAVVVEKAMIAAGVLVVPNYLAGSVGVACLGYNGVSDFHFGDPQSSASRISTNPTNRG